MHVHACTKWIRPALTLSNAPDTLEQRMQNHDAPKPDQKQGSLQNLKDHQSGPSRRGQVAGLRQNPGDGRDIGANARLLETIEHQILSDPINQGLEDPANQSLVYALKDFPHYSPWPWGRSSDKSTPRLPIHNAAMWRTAAVVPIASDAPGPLDYLGLRWRNGFAGGRGVYMRA